MKKVAATIFLVVMACIVVACNSSRVEGSESTVEAVVAEYNALVAQYNVAVAAHNDAIPAIVGANTYLEENILQFPALTLCNSANGGKALIFRRFRHLPCGRVLRISRRIPA